MSEPLSEKTRRRNLMNLEKKELEQCSDLDLATSTLHLLTFFFATLVHWSSSIYSLYFLLCILYFVFCIVYFLFCIFASPQVIFASLDFSIRGQRKSKFVVLHILQLLLFYESHFVACCNVYYGRRRLLQF